MQTFLILGGNSESRNNFITKQLKQHDVHPANHIRPSTDDLSIGIAQVRHLISQVMLRPMVGDSKALIIDTTTLTDEAQQALLKTLEEPPLNTSIYLSRASESGLLPTILSRCTIVSLATDTSPDPTPEQQQFWTTIAATLPLKRLAVIPDLGKERQEYRIFIQDNIMFLRSLLINHDSSFLTHSFLHTAITQGLQALDALEHNCNPKLTLDHWILSI